MAVSNTWNWLSLACAGPRGRQRVADDVYQWLVRPVHASTVGLFRFAYGLVMLMQILKWWSIFDEFKGSIYMLHYPGVFVKPVGPELGNMILMTCLISSLMLSFGLFTRAAGPVTFLTFAYMFHMCESLHNNHFILMCHLNFVGSFLNWGEWCSLDSLFRRARQKKSVPSVPYWNLLLLQLLFCIPYLFGSIAKLNKDWLLRAEPVRLWFSDREEWVYGQWWFPWTVCWGGMLFDLTISFFLMWKRTRFIIGFPGSVFFNVSNKLMLNIGVFPYAMICSLILFLDPHTPARVWHALNGVSLPIIPQHRWQTERDDKDEKKKKQPQPHWYKTFVLIFVGGFVAFHVLYPLRHFVLYRSNPSWTEEGHIGAWHMKLRSKHGWIRLEAHEKDGNITNLVPRTDPFVTRKQMGKIETRPHAMMLYIARLQMVFEEAGRPLESLHVKSCFSLNVNPSKQLFIPTANILDYVGKYEWIGTTAVDKFLYPYETAPACEQEVDEDGNIIQAKSYYGISKWSFGKLYRDAHFTYTLVRTWDGRKRKIVLHKTPGERRTDYGYTWKKWGY